ncbi:putative necrosis-inducing factor-domain-containing protein [Cladorrhinum sp. PSN259]|nr:putative necrosis-inducing factor-domain-containing protein [Cladorrhinum sp. PSN259]
MILSNIFLPIVAFLAALINCAPANIAGNSNVTTPAIPDNGTSASNTTLSGDYGECSWWSIDNHGSMGSPYVDDCRQIVTNIHGNGDWFIYATQQRTIVWSGSCALGIKASWVGVGINWIDVTGLITQSIEKYQWKADDGKWRVGTGGDITCNGYKGATWGLYHTK